MSSFDICIITASNRIQASAFRSLIQKRVDAGLYPQEIDFRVYAGPEKGRIGSGGGTLLAIEKLLSHISTDSFVSFLNSQRILILHAGGESRRLPIYAPEGKLFAPMPVDSSSLLPPIELDIQLSLFFKYPWEKGELLVGSGDVIIDFDTVRMSSSRGDICGFSKPAPVSQGARHRVYQFDRDGKTIKDFFQKKSEGFLLENAVFEGTDECALDIGLVSFSSAGVLSLVEFMNPTVKKNWYQESSTSIYIMR
jgi:fucokinase